MAKEIVRVEPGETIMDGWAANALINWAVGDGKDATREKLTRELNEYAATLAGPSPTPTETILAETAALSWFALRMHEAHFAGTSGSGMTINQAKFHLAKIDRAHARLMSSLRTLATVRRLALPALQINVAKHQVNQQVVSGSHD